jgi:hypothetical protein
MSRIDDFVTLWLEFVLYAPRNPEAQRKLVAGAQRSHAHVQELIEYEYAMVGVSPTYPSSDLAEISLALFNGLGLDRLVHPSAVTDRMLDTTLAFLYDAMGVDDNAVDQRAPR